MTDITDKLDVLEARARAATAGPWTYQEQSDDYTHIVRAPDRRFLCQLWQDKSSVSEANARHFAAFDPPTVLALIAVAKRAQAVLNQDSDCEAELHDLANALSSLSSVLDTTEAAGG